MNTDRYSEAIDYFRAIYNKNPKLFKKEVVHHWNFPNKKHGCLFLPLARSNDCNPMSIGYACPTIIRIGDRGYGYMAATPELTKMVSEDSNIPCTSYEITIDSLEHFAKYQRLADKAPKV